MYKALLALKRFPASMADDPQHGPSISASNDPADPGTAVAYW
jgi:hypothetical protein